jgi:AraC-like DNA-binding protein
MNETIEGYKELYLPHLKGLLDKYPKLETLHSYASPETQFTHPWTRLIFCVKGKYRVEISQAGLMKEAVLKPGQILYCSKDGAFVNGINDDFRLMTIIFWENLVRYLVRVQGEPHYWYHTVSPVNPAGWSLLNALRELGVTGEPGEKDSLLIRAILLIAMEKLQYEDEVQKSKALKSYQMIQEYIYSNFHLPINRESTAKELKMTPPHLSRLFKKFGNTSFNSELKRIRISKAKEMLLNSSLLLDEITSQCGFTNTGYFIKSFKKSYGISPGAFRNLHVSARNFTQ